MIELEHPIFGFERSNFEPNRAFTTLIKSLIELTRTSFFRTSNELELVHLMVIELEHPIFGFKRSNIELRTFFDPSLPTIHLDASMSNWANMVQQHNEQPTIH